MSVYLDDGDVVLHLGDCVKAMAAMPAESVDAVVTDPPYGLSFMGRTWDGKMPGQEAWEACQRILKPGGHLLAFGGTRTFHRLTCAIEDAGFEVRDCLSWLYGSGFPKSLDVSKAIDKAAGAERTEAAEWDGWGTALKPAWEPVVVARKPLAGTVAANVLKHGTGAINVDGCRVEASPEDEAARAATRGRWRRSLQRGTVGQPGQHNALAAAQSGDTRVGTSPAELPAGRWPANVVLDEQAAEMLDEANTGGPSRFFYTAKASSAERDGATHPTVKPHALMRWLVRLVTPLGGVVLDPFAGSGTTLLAARQEHMRAIGIEREAEYAEMAAHRLRQLSLFGGPC